MTLKVVPLTLKELNAYVEKYHRHHKKVQGHRFSLGVEEDGVLVGACSVGRPVARGCDPRFTAEVTRLVTDGTKNACSILYAASARACQAMGFTKIQTYILEEEPGTSLKAAGWRMEATTRGGDWNNGPDRKGKRRTDQPMGKKTRWARQLT